MSTELEVLASVEMIGCMGFGARCVLKYDVYCVRAESLNAMRAMVLSVQILARNWKLLSRTALACWKDVYLASRRHSCTAGCDMGAWVNEMLPPAMWSSRGMMTLRSRLCVAYRASFVAWMLATKSLY